MRNQLIIAFSFLALLCSILQALPFSFPHSFPLHVLSFSLANQLPGSLPLTSGPLTWDSSDGSDLCRYIRATGVRSEILRATRSLLPQFCTPETMNGDLQNLRQRFCSNGAEEVFPAICMGLTNAYFAGIIIATCCIVATTLTGATIGALVLSVRPKMQEMLYAVRYRQFAAALFAVSPMIYLGGLIAYQRSVLTHLLQDQYLGHGQAPREISTVQARGANGLGAGTALLMMSFLVQLIMEVVLIILMWLDHREAFVEEEGAQRLTALSGAAASSSPQGSLGQMTRGIAYSNYKVPLTTQPISNFQSQDLTPQPLHEPRVVYDVVMPPVTEPAW